MIQNSGVPEERFAFRPATPEEQKKHGAGSWWQSAMALKNTVLLATKGGDLYRFFGSPPPAGTPCYQYPTTTGWNWAVFSSPAMFRAIAQEHRNSHDGLFANDVAAETLLDIGSEIFGDELKPEDTISTCTPENSKRYRRLLLQHLGSALLKPKLHEIDALADKVFNSHNPHEQEINVTEDCQRITSAVINRFLLDLDENDAVAVAKAIVAANAYVLAKATKSANPQQFRQHADVLHAAINKALSKDTAFIRDLNQAGLTLNQKKAMIMVVYFTALGGTIAQMSSFLWHLAKNPTYQTELFQEIAAPSQNFPFTAKLIRASLDVLPTTLTIDRPTRQPVIMTYDYGDKHEEIYFPEKTILAYYLPWVSANSQFDPHRYDQKCEMNEKYDFGYKIHQCVGQYLAEELIGRVTRAFTRRFVSSTSQSELPIQGYFNLEPKGNVHLQVKLRS